MSDDVVPIEADAVQASMTPLLHTDGRKMYVSCPGCGLLRLVWFRVLTPDEARAWRAREGLVDVTAAILPPERRAEAMHNAAEADAMGMTAAWICCVSCGFDGPLIHGEDQTFYDARELRGVTR